MPETDLQVCESLIAEHRQMEGLLEVLEAHLRKENEDFQEDRQELTALMATIAREMDVHFACEEEALFPAVEPYHSMVLMEVEHEELMSLKSGIQEFLALEKMDSERMTAFKELGFRFINELYDHIGREDAGIFPACERALSLEEKQQVIEGMEQIRKRAKEGVIPEFSRPRRTFETLRVSLSQPLERPVSIRLLDESKDMQIKELLIQAGQALGPHWSPKKHILVCLQGEGNLIAARQQSSLQDKAVIQNGIKEFFSEGSILKLDAQLLHVIEAKTDCRFALLAKTV